MTTIATLSPLSTPEQRKLAQYEETIKVGKKAFLTVGLALVAIRDSKLYRSTHATFEDYCRERWQLAKSQAYRYMESAQVVEDLSQIGDTVPTDESHARILAEIPTTQKKADVWAKAVELAPKGKDGEPKVTAAHVRKAVQQVMHPEAEESDDEETDDPTDISEEPTPARHDMHGLTPKAVDEAMARLQEQERAKAAPKPAEPNELGELRKNIIYYYGIWTASNLPHVKVFVDETLKGLMSQ